MAGFVCLPCGNVVALWGEVRFGATEGGGCLFRAAGSVRGAIGAGWQCRGQRAWLGEIGSVCPERLAGSFASQPMERSEMPKGR